MRDSSGKFQKGFSGNAGGRPREIGAVRDLAQEYTVEAIESRVEIMRSQEAPPAARATAASAVLDRGWGKPHSTSDVKLETVDTAQSHLAAIKALAARPRSTEPTEH